MTNSVSREQYLINLTDGKSTSEAMTQNQHSNSTEKALRAVSLKINGVRHPGSLKMFNVAMRLWHQQPEKLEGLHTLTGYDMDLEKITLVPLAQFDWTESFQEWKARIFTGRSYRVYALYSFRYGKLVFRGVDLIDVDALTAPSNGNFRRLGVVRI